MRPWKRRPSHRVAPVCIALALFSALRPAQGGLREGQAAAGASQEPPAIAKTWSDPDRRQQIEEFLRSADVVSMESIPVGVTKPLRCKLAPGGPVAEMAWKPIKPGRYGGFWESYSNEIAAYELDKLLGLDMVPPTVERRVKGELGAAIMWASPTKSFKQLGGAPAPPPVHVASWNRQIVRAKLFDDLIGNIDPNQGNWLVDPAWNVILIDHTRSFTQTRDLPHRISRVDRELWTRMQQLTESQLTEALGRLIGRGEVRAILQRRDKLAQQIDQLVARTGEDAVFLK